jgi:hypothetical protein
LEEVNNRPSMKDEIQNVISVLVGMPLWSLGRAADLAWFQFGGPKVVKGWQGKEKKEVGDYALHVQCPWRIRLGHSIVVGRGDIFCTPEEANEPTRSDFDWQKGNRFDRVVQELFKNESRRFIVQTVEAGEAGSLAIGLNDGYKLEIFPHDSESGEHWRFFKPHTEEHHFVVTGKTLRRE